MLSFFLVTTTRQFFGDCRIAVDVRMQTNHEQGRVTRINNDFCLTTTDKNWKVCVLIILVFCDRFTALTTPESGKTTISLKLGEIRRSPLHGREAYIGATAQTQVAARQFCRRPHHQSYHHRHQHRDHQSPAPIPSSHDLFFLGSLSVTPYQKYQRS